MHYVQCDYGTIRIGDEVTATIDTKRRYAIRQHHSAVHLLQASLKRHIGDHVVQQGSFVGPDYARFDFSQPEKISIETLRVIEADVHDMIQEAYACTTDILPIEEAKKTGATAPFDEKYGDRVRIVTLGPRSKEFCGGTHVSNTSQIGSFAIVSEESIAAGVRRIQIVAGKSAYQWMKQKDLLLASIQQQLQANSSIEILDRLKAQLQEKESLKASVQALEKQHVRSLVQSLSLQEGPLPRIVHQFEGVSRVILGQVVDELKVKYPESLILLSSKDHDQYPLIAYMHPRFQTPTFHAGTLIKQLAQAMGGSGGGRNDLAFGSGKQAIDLESWLKDLLS
jgi:alanyl-tRNA synthetase